MPKIDGIELKLSEQAKYLGVILDPKLSWKKNVTERVKKVSIAFYSCRKMFGDNWGLYTVVVRPILTYGALVWWPALTRAYNIAKLTRIQRAACAGATGAMRSCPAVELNAILDIMPIELFVKDMAAQSAVRLKASN